MWHLLTTRSSARKPLLTVCPSSSSGSEPRTPAPPTWRNGTRRSDVSRASNGSPPSPSTRNTVSDSATRSPGPISRLTSQDSSPAGSATSDRTPNRQPPRPWHHCLLRRKSGCFGLLPSPGHSRKKRKSLPREERVPENAAHHPVTSTATFPQVRARNRRPKPVETWKFFLLPTSFLYECFYCSPILYLLILFLKFNLLFMSFLVPVECWWRCISIPFDRGCCFLPLVMHFLSMWARCHVFFPAVFGYFLDPPGNHPRGAMFPTVDPS